MSSPQLCTRLREYDEITAIVGEQFYDRTFRGLDWPARVAHYRSQVSCGDSDTALAVQINALLAELRASHTGLYTKRDLDYWALQSIFSGSLDAFPIASSGIWPKRIGEAQYAAYVLEDSPAARAGVLAGDLLVSLDGERFDPLGFDAQRESTLVVSSDGATQRTVRLRATFESTQSAFLRASIASAREIRAGAKRVGYFHLWAGTNARFLDALDSALTSFARARVDVLILDLRGGFGGAGLEYIENLKPGKPLGRVPKYVLIDDGVRSGKEWVAAAVRQQKIGTLVGSKTAGAFLAGRANQPCEGKYFLYVATAAFVPDGIPPIEGIGVPPDVAVPACRVYCGGRDAQLEKALALIGRS
ncbi:MAG TPA: S41 family peptidase [Steroidobacteraceae bacterium]|jgi:carboxyl-terminal processing protease|nr:S41 family peptidase [Steroidobacteraceae bacterium]